MGDVEQRDSNRNSNGVESFHDEHEKSSIEMKNIMNTSNNGTTEMKPLVKTLGESGPEEDGLMKEKSAEQQQEENTVARISPFSSFSNLTSREAWGEWFFPSDIPRECQLLRVENLAVPACYLLVGLLQGLSGPLINVYPIDLGATEAQQVSISSIRSLPASCKLIFGFISDNYPLCGYRRKSYMLLGWLLSSLSMLVLVFASDTSLSYETDSGKNEQSCTIKNTNNNVYNVTTNDFGEDEIDYSDGIIIPENSPSIPLLSLCLFGFGFGFWFADVMGDSIVAEKAKLEPPHSRGQLQSSCYSYRFFGSMIAAPVSTWMYNSFGPNYVFWLLAILPLCILPLVCMLYDNKDREVPSTKKQVQEIYKTVCSRAVWQPMAFVYVYNVLQIGNAAWKQFLKTGLGFTSCQLNMLFIVANILMYLGVVAYKYYLIKWSWRKVYISTTLLNTALSLLQILLILDITFGLSYFLFALGDDVFADFIAGIQFLPTTIMMVHLTPEGSEGASYAMFTTVNNSALTLSTSISTALLGIWDVSRETLALGDYSGLIRLTLLTTGLQTAGILFVCWLPHNKDELESFKTGKKNTSAVGGIIFLTVTFLSLLNAIIICVLNIVAPGWMGET